MVIHCSSPFIFKSYKDFYYLETNIKEGHHIPYAIFDYQPVEFGMGIIHLVSIQNLPKTNISCPLIRNVCVHIRG